MNGADTYETTDPPLAGSSPWPWAATSHYENFPVGSFLLPAGIRPSVAALYGFARYADDVADEGAASPAQRLAELARLREAIAGGTAGTPQAPAVVRRLEPHISRHRLDRALLLDLLSAFAQDVTTHRYATRADVLDYCRRSANPVGRLMLQLFGVLDDRTGPLSDAICTALQLINFLQDIAIDARKGRIYLPQASIAAAGARESMLEEAISAGRCPSELRVCLRAEATYARDLLERGRPLMALVPTRLALELRVIVAGARLVLDRLHAGGYDPVADRPRVRILDLPAVAARMFG
jgi:squalene synthase HpnC